MKYIYNLKIKYTFTIYNHLLGSSQKLTSRDLTQFAHHVAKGMEYLSSKKVNIIHSFLGLLLALLLLLHVHDDFSLQVVHRDLAARNVLVTDKNICKVTCQARLWSEG